MPEQKIYFQWQNEALRNTIYPLRTMNLRNALEYYQEIDLWKQFKDKKIEDMPEEVRAYHKKKAAVVKRAKQDFDSLLAYFYDTKVPLEDKTLDESMLGKLQALHDAFNNYYKDRIEKTPDPFRQSYFITQRLETLDRDRKELDKRVAAQLRRLNIMKAMNQDESRITAETQALDRLRSTQPVFEERRKKLVALISAFGKIEGLKKDFIKQRELASKQKTDLNVKLAPFQSRIGSKEAKRNELQEDVRRIRRHLQPEPAEVENYFADADTLTEMASRFPQADPEFCRQVDAIREEIAVLIDPSVIRVRLSAHISDLQLRRKRFEKRTNSTFKEDTLRAFDEVLGQMRDYWSELNNEDQAPNALENELKGKEQEMSALEQELTDLRKKIEEWEAQVKKLMEGILGVDEEHYFSQYKPVEPTLKDIVMLKLDEYRETLMKDGKDQDQYFLLDLLRQRFEREPQRFPRWLQYMIVHFSGMRYASAHGSWADPRDLYLSLQIGAINADLDKNCISDSAVEEICQRKIAEYTGAPLPETGVHHELSKLASTEDDDLKEKIAGHLALLKMDSPDFRRKGLFNLTLDEEDYEIKAMTEQEALEALEELRE